MSLSKIKKIVLSFALALGVVSGSVAAFGAPSQVVIPGEDVVEEYSNVTSPSQVVIPGKTVIMEPVKRATFSNATPAIATRSTATRTSSGSGSSYRRGSARAVTTSNTNTNPIPQGPGSNVTNTNPTNTTNNNVAPANTNNNGATKGNVAGADRGKLNVPKTVDASAMGIYAALLGLSTVGGAFVLATKRKED